MAALFDVEFNATDISMSREELTDAMNRCDVLVSTVTDTIDDDLLNAASSRLKLIAQFGAGTDNIDVRAAYRKGITVTNTPDVLKEDTADLTMALILGASRRMVEGASYLTGEDRWDGWSPTWMLGHRIHGKRLGIVGMGRIGIAVAERAKAFGLAIHYHNRHEVAPDIAADLNATRWKSLDEMLTQVDILSINCPSTPETFHLINAKRLSLLPKSAYVINTSRGEVIDEEALISALEHDHIAGAGLDVFEHEPAVNDRLCKLAAKGKVVLTPHMSSATIESRIEMGEKVIVSIKMMSDGDKPRDRVLP
ncbi:MAG: D-glycerate dehydrogenase [Pseudomonadota bacterium]